MPDNAKLTGNINKTRKALRLWGEYLNSPTSSDYYLGLPKSSCILSDGIDKHRKRAPIVTKPSALVLKVDEAMKFVANFEPVQFMALRYKYEKQMIESDAANEMGTSRKTYQTYCLGGEYLVAGLICQIHNN